MEQLLRGIIVRSQPKCWMTSEGGVEHKARRASEKMGDDGVGCI